MSEAAGEGQGGPSSARLPPGEPSPLRRRLAPVVLLVGLGLALLLFSRHYPRETEVVFRLEGARSSLTRLSVTFAAGGGEEDGGASWAFAAGQAPPSVRTTVKLPAGAVEVTASMDLERGATAVTRRRVTVDGGSITVPLRIVAEGE